MEAGAAGISGSDGSNDPQQQQHNEDLDEEPEEAVEWTRKIVRTYFTKQLSRAFSQEEIEEYIMMLAEITGKTQMATDAPKLAEYFVQKWGYTQGEEVARITEEEVMGEGFTKSVAKMIALYMTGDARTRK